MAAEGYKQMMSFKPVTISYTSRSSSSSSSSLLQSPKLEPSYVRYADPDGESEGNIDFYVVAIVLQCSVLHTSTSITKHDIFPVLVSMMGLQCRLA